MVMRSAMCAIGRYDTTRLPAALPRSQPKADSGHSAVHTRLKCDSMTPFGFPVVPRCR